MSTSKPLSMITGFSKLSKEEKLHKVSALFPDPGSFVNELKSFWHPEYQKLFDEFSENTLTNYYMPYGVAPNVLVNGKFYMVPMVIEESSVVAAASNSAKFWADKGGFHARVISTVKVGQVHFIWKGDHHKLLSVFPELKAYLLEQTAEITRNMIRRGGGILDIRLEDMTHAMDHYYQLKAEFDTVDSMGANFINSCLEEMSMALKDFLKDAPHFSGSEREAEVIMSILSNYTPECLVECWVDAPIEKLAGADDSLSAGEFAAKFERAIRVAQTDPFRATTHNKGIFNGIDAVALATGNDFRAIEACGHTWASRSGHYTSLTDIDLSNGRFKYRLTIPLAMGTVGGLTALHPMARKSLEMLGNPGAAELMMITAAIGLANNFGAIKSLITKGIQMGHMKMHLYNILNHFQATSDEKEKAAEYFRTHKVSFNAVASLIRSLRNQTA